MHRTSWLLELLILDTVGSQEPVPSVHLQVIRATDLAALNLHKTEYGLKKEGVGREFRLWS